MSVPLTEEDLHELYLWVDDIPISRPKRNITRDFSDGCCVAEVVKYFFPKLVDLHNYTPAMSAKQKKDNWDTLNNRVFRKLHFEVPQEEVNDITGMVPGAIERFLRALRTKIAQIKARREEMGAGRMIMGDDGEFIIGGREGSMHQQHNTNNYNHNYNNNNFNAPAGYRSPSATKGSPDVHQKAQVMMQSNNNKNNNNNNNNNNNKENNNINNNAPSASFRLLLEEKDRTIFELRETVSLLSEKVAKLEELVRVKDEKLNAYRAKLGRL